MPFIYQMTVIRFNKPNETESDEGYFPPDRLSLVFQVTDQGGGETMHYIATLLPF